MVRRVREMLRLHAEGVAEIIDSTAFASQCAVEEVARIELQARLRREHFQHAARRWFFHPREQAERAARFVEHPIMIVALAELKLLIRLIDPRSDGRRRSE